MALDVALAEVERPPAGRCGDLSLAAWFRGELRGPPASTPARPTRPTPRPIIATVVPRRHARRPMTSAGALEKRGFLTSHRSGYLTARNWIQFSLMTNPHARSPSRNCSGTCANLAVSLAGSQAKAI